MARKKGDVCIAGLLASNAGSQPGFVGRLLGFKSAF